MAKNSENNEISRWTICKIVAKIFVKLFLKNHQNVFRALAHSALRRRLQFSFNVFRVCKWRALKLHLLTWVKEMLTNTYYLHRRPLFGTISASVARMHEADGTIVNKSSIYKFAKVQYYTSLIQIESRRCNSAWTVQKATSHLISPFELVLYVPLERKILHFPLTFWCVSSKDSLVLKRKIRIKISTFYADIRSFSLKFTYATRHVMHSSHAHGEWIDWYFSGCDRAQ